MQTETGMFSNDKALTLVKEKINKENLTRQGLRQGKTLREVYNTYGVL